MREHPLADISEDVDDLILALDARHSPEPVSFSELPRTLRNFDLLTVGKHCELIELVIRYEAIPTQTVEKAVPHQFGAFGPSHKVLRGIIIGRPAGWRPWDRTRDDPSKLHVRLTDAGQVRAAALRLAKARPQAEPGADSAAAPAEACGDGRMPPDSAPTAPEPPESTRLPRAPATTRDSCKKLPSLGPHDRQAYQLSLLSGLTQQRIAEELNKQHGTTYGQGSVSRMIARAKRHAEASGLDDLIPEPPKAAQSIDPNRLEIGRRTDHRTRSQREKRNSDSD